MAIGPVSVGRLVHVGDVDGDGLSRGMASGGGFHGHCVAVVRLVVGRVVEGEDSAANGESISVSSRQRPGDRFLLRVGSVEGSDYLAVSFSSYGMLLGPVSVSGSSTSVMVMVTLMESEAPEGSVAVTVTA